MLTGGAREWLDAVEALADAATEGPWVHNPDAGGLMGCGDVWTAGPNVAGGSIAAPHGDLYPRGGYNPRGDMEFIAAARTDVPALVAALRAVLDAARSSAPEEVESSPEVAWVQGYNAAFTDIRAAIDAHVPGGAS